MSSTVQELLDPSLREADISSIRSGSGKHWTTAIAARIGRELSEMQQSLGDSADANAFLSLGRWTRSILERIGMLAAQGFIDPASARGRRLSAGGKHFGRHLLRLGVFPTAGNPLHWGHLLSGLAAMERFHLDKVIYVIAGDDPRKPYLASARLRHHIAKKVIGLFHPLFEYSPIALGSTVPGETNVFQIMAANGLHRLHAFYLAGSDHFHRFAPQTGNPDTIQRLEEGVRGRIAGFNPNLHRLTAVFLDRGDRIEQVESFLDVRWINRLPLKASSTRIRGALGGREPLCELIALPFTAYCAIGVHGEYRIRAANGGGWPSRPDLVCGADQAGDSLLCLRQEW